MLAANGLHLYWSQTARMYSMACFLGLLSTVLLVLIIKGAARQRTYRVLYFLFTVAGLATHVYFWAVFATQAVWVFAENFVTSLAAQPSPVTDICLYHRQPSGGHCRISKWRRHSSEDAR